MTTNVTVGHKVTYVLAYLDQNEQPMRTTPTPDSPPTWSDAPSDPSVDSFTVDPTGLDAILSAKAPGTDLVKAAVVVGGVTFSASDTVVVSEEPQVLTSIALVPTII